MIRALLRLVVFFVVVVVLIAFFLGYRWGDISGLLVTERPLVTGDDKAGGIDRERVRERGAALGEKVAEGAQRAERALAESRLTAKIKSKIALDDTLDATQINVDTEGSTVTLRGTVHTPAQRERARQLARETEGVTSVDDRLEIVPR